ncbi:MAG: hypothetical protein AAFV53_00395 [Myxococcota bacterium]
MSAPLKKANEFHAFTPRSGSGDFGHGSHPLDNTGNTPVKDASDEGNESTGHAAAAFSENSSDGLNSTPAGRYGCGCGSSGRERESYQTAFIPDEDTDLDALYADDPERLSADIKALVALIDPDDPGEEQLDALDELESYQQMWHPGDATGSLWVDAGTDQGRLVCPDCEGCGTTFDVWPERTTICTTCAGTGSIDEAPYSRHPRVHSEVA